MQNSFSRFVFVLFLIFFFSICSPKIYNINSRPLHLKCRASIFVWATTKEVNTASNGYYVVVIP